MKPRQQAFMRSALLGALSIVLVIAMGGDEEESEGGLPEGGKPSLKLLR